MYILLIWEYVECVRFIFVKVFMATLLSETLRQIIAEYGVVITNLAQMMEIDRTTLQHIISGKRSPNKMQMDKLLQFISIPTNKKTMILQAYEATIHGADKFKQHEKIKSIIEKIAFSSMVKPASAVPSHRATITSTCETEDLYGILAINQSIINVVNDENESVSFFMPPNFSFFYDTLFAKFITSETLSVTCFFPISDGTGNAMSDLEYFESFIPFFASQKHGFQAHFMRGQNPLNDTSIVPFPYFISTSTHVLLLSADMNHAILTKQETFMQMYHEKCQNLLSISSPLCSYPSFSDLLLFLPNSNSPKDITSSIENQPCFQFFLTKQLIEKYTIINSEEDAAFINLYKKYICDLQKEPNFFCAFGSEGLMHFVETGILAVWPPSLTGPFDVPDRIEMLERMLLGIKNDEFHCRMIDTSKLTLPLTSTVVGVSRNTLRIMCLDYDNGNVKNIFLTEKNIVGVFTDFFNSLPNLHLVHSKEETVKAFEAALMKLKTMQPS